MTRKRRKSRTLNCPYYAYYPGSHFHSPLVVVCHTSRVLVQENTGLRPALDYNDKRCGSEVTVCASKSLRAQRCTPAASCQTSKRRRWLLPSEQLMPCRRAVIGAMPGGGHCLMPSAANVRIAGRLGSLDNFARTNSHRRLNPLPNGGKRRRQRNSVVEFL